MAYVHDTYIVCNAEFKLVACIAKHVHDIINTRPLHAKPRRRISIAGIQLDPGLVLAGPLQSSGRSVHGMDMECMS